MCLLSEMLGFLLLQEIFSLSHRPSAVFASAKDGDSGDRLTEFQSWFYCLQAEWVFLLFKNLSIYLFLAVLDLCCCAWAFSSCGEPGYSSLQRQASHCGGFSCCGARALGTWASVVVAYGLSCSVARGTFSDQGLNPCLLHWQADS